MSYKLCSFRVALSKPVSASVRSFSRPAFQPRTPRISYLRRVGLFSGAALTATFLVGNTWAPIHAQSDEDERPSTPLSALLRTYVVYAMCSIPPLIDWSPTILSTLSSIPGLKQITEVMVRVTFFNQFVGGDTAEDAVPLVERLRAENTGCLFAYSVEVDEEEAAGKTKGTQKTPVYKQSVQETIRCIDVAADLEDKYAQGSSLQGRRTWVAVKLTALLPDAHSLINFSSYLVASRPAPSTPVPFPGCPHTSDFDILHASHRPSSCPLTDDDVIALSELYDDIMSICKRAQERGVRIIIDAEYSWYQPAVDAYTLALSRTFNKLPEKSRFSFKRPSPATQVQPLIYGTYQAYLRRTPAFLAQSFQAADAGGYALGVKLVRGAYHPHELAAHAALASYLPAPSSTSNMPVPPRARSLSISPDALPPVWSTKPETDACFNACLRALVARIGAEVSELRPGASPTLAVLLGTHNWDSVDLMLDELVRRGLAKEEADGALRIGKEVSERLSLAQLYGMHDSLTQHLVNRIRTESPFVLKYIPYGSLSEVMPYLGRRAIENKSLLGNGVAAEERRRAAAEIRKRIFG